MLRALVGSALCCVGCSSAEPISPALSGALALPALGLEAADALTFEQTPATFTRADGPGGLRWELTASDGVVRVGPSAAPLITVTPLASPCRGRPGQLRGNAVVYSDPRRDCAVVLGARADGLKEDLVLARDLGARLTFSWRLQLGPGLEARREQDGSVALSGPDHRVRYRFPAPVVRDATGRQFHDRARFELDADILSLAAENLSTLRYPLTIDPTLLVTLTAEFTAAGNDEGNLDFGNDRLARVQAKGGVGAFAASTSLPAGRSAFAAVAAGSNLYVIGGNQGAPTAEVLVAPLTGTTVGPWRATTPLPGPREHASALAYDGFLYVIGGFDGVTARAEVYRAVIQPGGELGAFTLVGTLPSPRSQHTSAVWANRLYVLGGTDGTTFRDEVLVARLNGDGSLGAFAATTPFPFARAGHATVVHDGRLYVIGGSDGTNRGDVQLASIAPSGTVGPWRSAGTLTPRTQARAAVFGGHLLVTGGSQGAPTASVQVAPLTTNGTLGPWVAGPDLPSARAAHGAVVFDEVLYVVGGAGAAALADVHAAPLVAPPPLSGWPPTAPIPARSAHASALYTGFVYVSGGDGAAALGDVRFAPVNTSGGVGAWTSTTALPGNRSGHTMVAVNGFLYTAGGYDGTGLQNTVHVAPIAPDGTIGAWVATSTFITGRYEHMMVAANGYLYLLGGYNAGTLGDVQFARINQDGTLGPFTLTTALPRSRYGAAAAVSGGYLYVTGGWSTTGSTFLNDTSYAALNPDGTLGPFVSSASFATPRLNHTAVIWDGALYLLGGDANTTSTFADVQVSRLTASGALGAFSALAPLPSPRSGHTSVVYSGHLFVLGGSDGTAPLSTVLSARLPSSGGMDPFVGATPVPLPRYGHTSVAAHGFLYVVGGWDTANLVDVRFAPISASGSVGAWVSTTPLPSGRSYHQSFVHDGYLFVLGGTGDLMQFAEVLSARLNLDGTLGPWVATTPLPGVIDSHSAAVWNGHAYVLGGDYTNTVWEAPLLANGTLGSWTARTSFNDGRRRHTTVVYDGFIYVIGGLATGARYLDTVQVAPLLPDGSVGAWVTTTSFANGRYCHASVAYAGYLYVFGGLNAETLADTQVAPINADGTLGAWMGTPPLLEARFLQGVALDDGNLYLTAGLGPSANLGSVEVTRLLTPAPRAVYSKLFDFGGPVALDSITVSGNAAARGKVLLDYEVAPASGLFGTRAPSQQVTLGVAKTVGELDVRYLWVRLVLDDSESAVSPLDAPNALEVTDLSIAFTPVDAGVPDAGVTDAGVVDAGVVDAGVPAPSITSSLQSSATCGRAFSYSPTVEGLGPFSFGVSDEPGGVTVDELTGEVSWTPTRAQQGLQRVELLVNGVGGARLQTLEIEVLCEPKAYQVGCTSGGDGLAGLLLLLFVARRRASS